MHALFRSAKGISKLSLIILLLATGTVGAVLSYLWTIGYYVEMGHYIPEEIAIAVQNVTFPIENSSYFDATIINPSYSTADANITTIVIINTSGGFDAVSSTEPSVPYVLGIGENVTFRCNKKWGNYTGQEIGVAVFVKDGSGATKVCKIELVQLEMEYPAYNTTVTINQFNMTVHNRSRIPLDISEVHLGNVTVPSEKILLDGQGITLPYRIPENDSRVFTFQVPLWDAEADSGLLGTTTNFSIKTLQGYFASRAVVFSNAVVLTVTNVTYPQLNATQFILKNEPQSPHSVNISYVTINIGDQTYTVASMNATGYVLEKGQNITVLCVDGRFNWSGWSGQKITIRVYTTQGFLAKKEEIIPSG